MPSTNMCTHTSTWHLCSVYTGIAFLLFPFYAIAFLMFTMFVFYRLHAFQPEQLADFGRVIFSCFHPLFFSSNL